MRNVLFLLSFLLLMTECNKKSNQKFPVKNHTYGNYADIKISHLDLNLEVNFEAKQLKGSAKWTFENTNKVSQIIFDHKEIKIEKVLVNEKETNFQIGDNDTILGAALSIPILPNSSNVEIFYSTLPSAEALQWLTPEQTNDKKHPFLFSQSQAILARTWIPIMDAPAIRFTYNAKIKCPKNMLALMSAENPVQLNSEGQYSFKMDKPIPSYLMAIACGDIQFKNLGTNCGVYAEPGMIDKSASEFSDMQEMINQAGALYGPYAWGRYDVLVLPPSFPFGGMENPKLTFATPTIIAGDKSLVSLIAHELAHSWSGNLVTNETWDDFWLNEGFTVYFEQRIMEKIYGRNYSEMQTSLAMGELKNTLSDLMADEKTKNDTKLFLNLEGRNPDDGVSDIAYEKGRFFLRSIENTVGRENWDAFLKKYFTEHAFQTNTTEKFIAYLEKELLSKNADWKAKVNYKEWIYGTGLPSNCEVINSVEFEKVLQDIKNYSEKFDINSLNPSAYTTHHWMYFLRNLPQLSVAQMTDLDKKFKFSESGNAEILCDWFQLSIKYNYMPAMPHMRKFLNEVGRRKFLMPLYKNLIKTEAGAQMAKEIFKEAKPKYHFVSASSIEELLSGK